MDKSCCSASGCSCGPSLTAEIFTIPLENNRHLVYAPLRRPAFVANSATVNFLADLKDGKYDSADDPGGALVQFLRRLEIVDGGAEAPPITEFRGTPRPVAVTLFLTTACNLRCTYCYASAGDTPTRNMPIDVAKKGIDYVIGNAAQLGVPTVQIGYHGGGEPTVNWQVLTGSLVYARERAKASGLSVHASLATNGVLADDRLGWIVKNIDDASLSFDGLPEVHDRHRPTVSGHGSSSNVVRTMEAFDAASFRYGVRMTVTADQIEQLPDSVGYVCERFRPRRIQVEPAYRLGRWQEAPSAETASFVAAYREAQARARALGREITFSGARLGLLSNHFCGISQDGFSLSPDGNVTACYEAFSEKLPFADRFFYGRPNDAGYSFDMPVLETLRGQSVQHRRHCQGCFAKWSCGGDCHNKALHAGPDGEFAGTERCHIIRALTLDQIIERIAGSGGWFWHEPLPELSASVRKEGGPQ